MKTKPFIVVRDIRKAAKAWATLLGVPEPEICVNHLESNGEYPYTYRGNANEPSDLQMRVTSTQSAPSVFIPVAAGPSWTVRTCWV